MRDPVQRGAAARIIMVAVACVAWGIAWCAAAGSLHAQIAPDERWRTIATVHFRVHFTPALEGEARHAAAVAERAYANLASELVAPRGPVDLVVSDATDASNGAATTFPRNHVIIYARPPVDEPSLESYDDWTVLVLQHELAHIFQLDRSRGWWRAAQSVFGRNPVLFPSSYTPAWLTEGLAVYYESRYTSGGRLEGTYQSAVARAAAIDRLTPRLDQLSLATTRFPYGQSAYVYGSFVWDEIARTRGPAAVPAFVERYSAETIPFLVDRVAKRSFGETFSAAWRQWRDSVVRGPRLAAPAAGSVLLPGTAARLLPGGGRQLIDPRWESDSTLVYVANPGRETPAVFRARIDAGVPRRLARRNTLDVNSPWRGMLVYAQTEFEDRFRLRSDLYRDAGGVTTRLTSAARLSAPDVRGDGSIIAVRTVPASTELVRVSERGDMGPVVAVATRDTQWATPRWSPDGARIAAVRIAHGTSELVVLDTVGGAPGVLVSGRGVLRSPAWTPDGSALVFTSDVGGASQLYMVPVTGGRMVALTDDPAGVYSVDLRGMGDSVRVATTVLRSDGFHVAVWTAPASAFAARDAIVAGLDPRHAPAPPDSLWRVTDASPEAHRYSAWRTLLPSYWSPTYAAQVHGTQMGAMTSGADVIGRHAYAAEATVNTRNRNVEGSLNYSYLRWREPVLAFGLQQAWNYATITSKSRTVGELSRRARYASVRAGFVRQRVRTFESFTLGAELEERAYGASPDTLLRHLDPFYATAHRYPIALAGIGFSNAQRPTLSISPEDGVAFSAAVRQRWESGNGSAGRSAVAVAATYKSLDLPGFAHHVLALRGAIGAADRRTPSVYDVGGVNGTSLDVIPGVTVGSTAHTFPVRGFPSGAQEGIAATAVSAEYRAPLAAPGRGVGLFPVFLDRSSVTVFADAGRAACPARARPACSPASFDGPTLASIGAELDLDAALQFDVPYRFRLGLAHPVRGAGYARASALSAFVTLGGTF